MKIVLRLLLRITSITVLIATSFGGFACSGDSESAALRALAYETANFAPPAAEATAPLILPDTGRSAKPLRVEPVQSEAPVANAAAGMPSPAAVQRELPVNSSGPRTALTTAELVERYEESVALIKGKSSMGTGFLIAPGILATNAHVIEGEFIDSLEVRFPSAEGTQKGPFPARMLYKDPVRDLAFFAVNSTLKPLDIAPSYRFRKGEDITVIGNPGVGAELVLENAISRGVVSSKTTIEGKEFLQLGIAINPGNSGGPVFDSTGQVIGVVTLKTVKQEGLAFSIPPEDLQSAARQAINRSDKDAIITAGKHNLGLTFEMLSAAGVFYTIGLDVHRVISNRNQPLFQIDNKPFTVADFDGFINEIDNQAFALAYEQSQKLRNDTNINQAARANLTALASNYNDMKSTFAQTNLNAGQLAPRIQTMRARHIQLITELAKNLNVKVPQGLIQALREPVADPLAAITSASPQIAAGRTIRSPLGSRLGGSSGLRQRADQRREEAQQRSQDLRNRMKSRRR